MRSPIVYPMSSRLRAIGRIVHAVLLFMLSLVPAFAGKVNLFSRQPEGSIVRAIRTDNSGNIYISGSVSPSNTNAGDSSDAFVAKLSSDGSQVYKTVIAGSATDFATTIALGVDGSVYVAGRTSSRDFPITSSALQSTLGTNGQAFLAKLSPNGQIQSATYFGGGAQTFGTALAISDTGEVYLTGTSSADGFPSTPGNTGIGNGFFLAKFDASLSRLLFATLAYGGSVITLDPQGSIYTAAAATGKIGENVSLQTSPGAFQGSPQAKLCRGGGIVFFACSYQFVQKLDPTATKLGYATFITGSFGATPAGIAVDSAGNVIVAGTTNSADYPVTARALQTSYVANATAPPILPSNRGTVNPPPSTGYITKLNATGTGLVWSTFFGGSVQDAISGVVVDANGYVHVTGQANSNDLPGLSAPVPEGCEPTVNQGLGFVARLSPDGESLSPTQLIYGAPSCTYASCFPNTQSTSSSAWALAVGMDGSTVVAGTNGAIARVDLFGSERLACVTDPADNVQLTAVAPGQVLSIFGSRVAPSRAAVPPSGAASTLQGVSVTFNGIVAPVLYTSGEQINVQVPYEISSRASVEMQVVSLGEGLTERKTLSFVQQQPSVFLSPYALLSDVPGYFYCGDAFSRAQHALAINADGTLNTCQNGALPGSTVTIFLNGLGLIQPPQSTGTIVASPPVPITPGAAGTDILSTTTSPGLISGVVQVQLQPTSAGFVEVAPTVAGVAVRQPVAIWVAAR
jgi:uncharacterized protein (TIGR03437 family)